MSAPRWSLARGANVVGDGVRFSVWAPNVQRVSVRVPGRGDHALSPRDSGIFETVVDGLVAGADYQYLLDDDKLRPDPVSRFQPEGVHGPSRIVDPSRFGWTDGSWKGVEMAQLVIYELHVGTFSADGTFAGVIPFLAYLRELGVTAIEIMPVAQFPGSRNWGYDGVDLYAVQASYGGPDALCALVDAAHGHGLAVILDVVYNHVGPEGNYLADFGPYFTTKYTTPWGPAVNYDDAFSDEVRRFVVENALYWITEYHVDGLRLDAIHGIFDFSPRHILQDIAEAVHRQGDALGRRVLVIGESDLNDPRVVRPPDRCGYGLDAQWADDLHHAIHAALTGESKGYYADFGGMAPIARALDTPFVFDGRYSTYRRRRHGSPPTGVPRDRFVVCIQNHDQVGNRAAGERLTTLIGLDKCRLAAGLLLLAPYVPLLFMGEEYGATTPFLYFVSHGDRALIEAVREGRRREFERFEWVSEVPDPQAPDTFLRSRLDRSQAGEPGHANLLAWYRRLLALRRSEPTLRPGAVEPRTAFDADAGWITLELARGEGCPGSLFVVHNLSARDAEIPAGAMAIGEWTLCASSDMAEFGGAGRVSNPGVASASRRALVMWPPFSTSVYRLERV